MPTNSHKQPHRVFPAPPAALKGSADESPQGLLIGIYGDAQVARAARRALTRRPQVSVSLLSFDAETKEKGTDAEKDAGVDPALRERYQSFVMEGETLMLVTALGSEIATTRDALRHVKGGYPATFVIFAPPSAPLFPSASPFSDGKTQPVRSPLPHGEQEAAARKLAQSLDTTDERRGTLRVGAARVLAGLRRDMEVLRRVQMFLSMANKAGQSVSIAGEWLLDNAFVLQGHGEDVQRSLTTGFFSQLPVGPDNNPRASLLAAELVETTGARLDATVIHDVVQAFQTVLPLRISELWALPLLLRLHLIAMVRAVSLRAERRQREAELADFWASRLLRASRNGAKPLQAMVEAIKAQAPDPSAYLADQLVAHLYDEEASLSAVRTYLEEAAGGTPLAERIVQGQREEAIDQVTISNAVGSLRRLGSMDWRSIFESLSHVHALLTDDPSGVYSKMDFATRDIYRHAVEEIASRSPLNEIEVAEAARDAARLGEDDLRRHIGYWLIDRGKSALASRTGFRPTLRQKWLNDARSYPDTTYVGAVLFFTVFIDALVLRAGMGAGLSGWLVPLFAFLALFPASDLAVQIVNAAAAYLLPPDKLPRLDFEHNGIPDEERALVVVPMMLLTPLAIGTEVERLEIRYLGNPDANLRFALLADYADAPLQHMPEDAERLDAVARGVQALNEKYGAGKFFLFHRERQWSESEDRWIGWERKRGKLEQLNAFLVGETTDLDAASFLRVGDRHDLAGVRSVITLDADTQLPRDAARRLVGTIAHPLNRPRLALDGMSVDRGYTIIQPRVSTVLPSATETWFTRLFTPSAGTDPYTNAVSDVYQDLARDGSYHGKGIYDVHAFHQVLHNRLPEAHVLSHDLLEGAHVRVGLATDIELFDQFPRDYPAFARRQHRWVRGDWQIADWLFPRVPTGKGKSEPNPLSLLSRWKIFDNLRRSLLAPATVTLAVGGWLLTPLPLMWTIFAYAPLLLSLPLSLFRLLLAPARNDVRSWREFALAPVRSLVEAAFLPHQSLLNGNAIFLVAERRVTRHHLLEWETAAENARRSRDRQTRFVQRLLWVPTLAAVLLGATVWNGGIGAGLAALPLLLPWALSPLVVLLLGRDSARTEPPVRSLSSDDKRLLRKTARQTWRFFDDFVGESSHHLPPDNYQDFESVGIATRTSPTNIGLALLSTLAAHDLGYLTPDATVSRTFATLKTLDTMEKYEGNLYNWYSTTTAEPLHPRYVSYVDSGNLLGCLWTLARGYDELLHAPVVDHRFLQGMTDTLHLLRDALHDQPVLTADANEALLGLSRLLEADGAASEAATLEGKIARLRGAAGPAALLAEHLSTISGSKSGEEEGETPLVSSPAARYWANRLHEQAGEMTALLERYLGWATVLADVPADGLSVLGQNAHEWRRQALEAAPSFLSLARGDVPGLAALVAVRNRADALGLGAETRTWLDRLNATFEQAQKAARQCQSETEDATLLAEKLAAGINLRFLYDNERRTFRIGYNVEERKGDDSFYDMLASESRLGSFVSIARGEVPTEHWWALGRPYGAAYGRRVLLSWNGTMFEYLMPHLLMRAYDGSLLAEASESAVMTQMAYGRERGVPWGISEAAYSALDAGHSYQYYAFGVPRLRLNREDEERLVVAPYATILALMVDPAAAVENLRRLATLGLRGDRGFYDSIDYTRERADGQPGVVVQTVMAHHKGMSLLALVNLLENDPMPRRFHSDRRVASAEPLLYERIPFAPPLTEGYAEGEAPASRLPLRALSVAPAAGESKPSVIETADTHTPRTWLLSNGAYHVMVTNGGGGYSRWNDTELTRWRADTTCDAYGSFIYLRDVESGDVWSTAYQPTHAEPSYYAVKFSVEKAEFRRRDFGIDSVLEIAVSPEDAAEVRRVTLINRSNKRRQIELTSYMEVALAPHMADRAHPAFSKMFVRTEALFGVGGTPPSTLLAMRRPRSSGEAETWAVHSVQGGEASSEGSYETDRAAFLGRGRTAQFPAAFEPGARMGEATGSVLDPVLALRRIVTLEPGERVQIGFVLGAGATRDEVTRIADTYRDAHAFGRAFDLAWNRAQLELRHLGITPDEVQRFQLLAGAMLYPSPALRVPSARLAQNQFGQQELWKYGISGDLPILAVTIRDLYDTYVVREILMAHLYWRLHGFKTDLVILNEEGASYERPLQNQLVGLAASHSQYTAIDQPGGVFVRPVAEVPREDRTLLLSAARAVIVAARGPLAQQLALAAPAPELPPVFAPTRPVESANTVAGDLPQIERTHFNGFGGFTPDGREYVIDLLPHAEPTPQPWINVLANERFGTIVTESGAGFAWDGNSQSNRLTPWSNDWVSDPVSDALYLRDEETGAVWTPTPQPIRLPNGAYRTRHGQGYSIFEHESHHVAQTLTVFVPLEPTDASDGDISGGIPARLQILRLRNTSDAPRKLTATVYVEWTLGVEREDTQMYVRTEWDKNAGLLLAHNPYRSSFAERVAFLGASVPVSSHTGDRTEFLGRNQSAGSPAALKQAALSNHVGAGFDPCGALQVTIDLAPGEEKEIVFVLGEADDADSARSLAAQLTKPDAAQTALETTQGWWAHLLEAVQVETPDRGADVLINHWLLYQDLSCRVWGRSAFYQSGGAFGFRDQLQDVLALVYAAPAIARAQIVRASARQFEQGDVQHWWHPPGGAGVRTRISDDLLWLPFAVAHYIRVTSDDGILDETVPFLRGRELNDDEHEALFTPEISPETGSLLEHCRRAVHKGNTQSSLHGLPLIGAGDWNDGLNRVGTEGKGESVWLAWFLCHVLDDWAYLLDLRDASAEADQVRTDAKAIAAKVEETAWDGNWYLRGYFDDGTPLGSHESDEAKIDSLGQSWAVISGHGNLDRAAQGLEAVWEQLVKKDNKGRVLLFTPPFDKTTHDPGYIKGYPPGVRENGGQYTHGSLWVPLAFARRGDGSRAVELLHLMSPVEHAQTRDDALRYRVEPYVVAADIYSLAGREGRGGWTWYTGSAGWMYRVWLEEILGFQLRGNILRLSPCLPDDWPGFRLRYRHQTATYVIDVERAPDGTAGFVEVDGARQDGQEIRLQNDGQEHGVRVVTAS